MKTDGSHLLIYNDCLEFIRNVSAEPQIGFRFRKGSKGYAQVFVLLKTDLTRTSDVVQKLRNLPERPFKGVRLYHTMNCFGTWNLAIWFEAEKHDYVIDFVHNKIWPIPGVVETYLVPTTPIKEYINWK